MEKLIYDPNGILQEPVCILTTRSGKRIGAIPFVNIVYHSNENTANELSFDVNRCDVADKTFWNKIKDFKLVYIKEYDEFFEISVEIEDGEKGLVKHVSGKSLGYAELSQILLRNVQINTEDDIARDDYEPTVIYDEENPKASLLDRILEKAPHYHVGHVDKSIARLQRQFTFSSSIVDAINAVASEAQCIIKIDTKLNTGTMGIDRSISLYDLQDFCMDCGERGDFTVCPKCGSTNIHTGYGDDTTIFVCVENLADSINYSVDVDSVKNCFRLEAGDDLMTATIAACNLNGTNYIWYVSEDQREDMSDELVQRLDEYDAQYDYYQNEYIHTFDTNNRSAYNEIYTEYHDYKEGMTELPESVTGHETLMEELYNTIDMKMFLEHELMPLVSPVVYNASDWVAYLAENFTNIAVADLASATETTVTSAVVSEVKAIVGSKYKVTTEHIKEEIGGVETDVPYYDETTHKWSGIITLVNIGDDTDTDSITYTEATGTPTLTVTGDYEQYVKQKIDRILGSKTTDKYAMRSILAIENEDIETMLTEYSLAGLEAIMNACQGALDVLIQQGIADPSSQSGSDNMYSSIYLPYYTKYRAIESEYARREEQIATVEAVQNEITEDTNTINSQLNFQDFIGTELWTEFAMYRREDSYQNANYISDGLDNAKLFEMAKQFVETARKDIVDSATAQHSITATLKNILTMKEFSHVLGMFNLGNWIRLKVDDNIYRLRLVEYEIDYNNAEKMSVSFSDVKVGSSGLNDFDSLIQRAANMTTSYGMVARQASKGEMSMSAISDFVDNGLYLTNKRILNTENQDIQIDEHGILGREYLADTASFDDRQIRIINRGFYTTNDSWATSNTAIGEFTFWNPVTQQYETKYGVIADALVGNLVLGKNIGVYNEDGSVSLGESGFVLTTQSEDNETVFTIRKAVDDGEGNITYEPLMTIDSNGNIVLNGNVNLNMEATEKPNPFTNDTTINEFYSSVVANANQIVESFRQVNEAIGEINGEIRRGFVDLNGTRYFGIVISQERATIDDRGDPQYTVPDGVSYYSDAELTTLVGTTTAPYDSTNFTTTAVAFEINGVTYYADIADCIFGYVHSKLNPDDGQWYYEIDTNTGVSYGLYTAGGWSFWNGATRIGWFDANTNKLYVGDVEIITTFTMSNWVMTTKKRDMMGNLFENGYGLRYIERTS